MFAAPKAKKLASILATSVLMTITSIEADLIVDLASDIFITTPSPKIPAPNLDDITPPLKHILYIHYLFYF